MIALRCTQRLLKRLGATPETDAPPPANALGNWYASLVYVGRAQFVMATSERSLLTVLLPAANLRRSLVPNLCDSTAILLREIGVDDARASREVDAMRQVRYCRTESRSVLGSMNDFSRSLDWYLHDGIAPLECMLRFADTPMTGLGSAGESHGYAAEVARSLLGVEGKWSRLAPRRGT